MKTPHISLPHSKFLNKTVLLIALAVGLILVVISVGAIEKVRSDKAEAAHNAAVARDAETKQKALNDRITALEADNKDLPKQKQRADLACLELKRLDGIRTITSQVTVPQYCL